MDNASFAFGDWKQVQENEPDRQTLNFFLYFLQSQHSKSPLKVNFSKFYLNLLYCHLTYHPHSDVAWEASWICVYY